MATPQATTDDGRLRWHVFVSAEEAALAGRSCRLVKWARSEQEARKLIEASGFTVDRVEPAAPMGS